MKKTDTASFKRWFRNSKVVDEKGDPLVVYHGTDKAGFFEFEARTFGENSQNDSGFFFTDDWSLASSYMSGRADAVDLEQFGSFEELLANTPDDFEITKYFYVPADKEENQPYYKRYDSLEELEEDWELEEGDRIGEEYEVTNPDGYSATYDISEKEMLLEDVNSDLTRREGPGIYEVYLRIEEPLIVNADGANWDEIPYGDWEDEDGNLHPDTMTTNEIIRDAQEMGFDGVIFYDLFDAGGKGYGAESGNVYVVFDPRQIKSVQNRGNWDPEDPILINPSNRRRKHGPR